MSSTIAAVISPETCPAPRPLLIDERDGPCEFCQAWAARPRAACTRCNRRIAIYQNMGGAGFQSPRPHHYHLDLVLDVVGRRAIWEELCLDCYCRAWQDVYPDEPLPVPPMELVEAKLPSEITRAVEGEVETTGEAAMMAILCEPSRRSRELDLAHD